jgi:hypothetical protein
LDRAHVVSGASNIHPFAAFISRRLARAGRESSRFLHEVETQYERTLPKRSHGA